MASRLVCRLVCKAGWQENHSAMFQTSAQVLLCYHKQFGTAEAEMICTFLRWTCFRALSAFEPQDTSHSKDTDIQCYEMTLAYGSD